MSLNNFFQQKKLATLIAISLTTTVLIGCDSDDNNIEQADFTLQLLHVADMDGSDADALNNVGNFARNLNAFRSEYPENTLFLSSGDNYIPGARYAASDNDVMSNIAGVNVPGNGRADIAMLNAMGLQVSAVGNHDMDGGTEEFAAIVAADNAYAGAQFPYLSSNLIFSDDSNLEPLVTTDGQMASDVPNQFTSSVIIEVDGEKVGIVGATTPTQEVITSTGDVTVLPISDSITELAALIQQKVDALTSTGINKVILLAHMQTISVEKELAGLLQDVDIIVAGGSNTRLADSNDRLWAGDTAADTYPLMLKSATDENVAIVNVDGDYKYLGRLVVGFNESGEVLNHTIDSEESGAYISDSTMADELGGATNSQVDSIVAAVNGVIISAEENILGHSNVFLNGIKSEVRSEETNLGNLTANANLWYAQQYDSEVEISLKNGGGIRASIGYATYPAGSTNPDDLLYLPTAAFPAAGKAAGDISQFDLQSALKFNNSLVTMEVTAAQLKAIVEHSISSIEPTDSSGYGGGRFPQIAGISFSYNPENTAREVDAVTGVQTIAGERVTELRVGSEVIVTGGVIQGDEMRTFKLVTLGYLGTGGDGYPFPCIADDCSGNQTELSSAMATADPAQSNFAETGSEQDALAEYMMANYPDAANAYNAVDTIDNTSITDSRIVRSNL